MAHHPMWRPDSTEPERPDLSSPETAPPETVPPTAGMQGAVATRQESEFAELAAKFAAHGGGKIPAELSKELALDVVLNEIVEQACLATGASGAAIALRRGEEMVCRASSGDNAPELGTHLDTSSGLSGACVRSRQIQCCEDALTDSRVDAEISRQLGMRSVVVQPLLRDEELIGIFEIFSPLPAAFGEHDLRRLEVLAKRVLNNAEARQASLISIGLAAPELFPTPTQENAAQPGAAEENPEEIGNRLQAEVRSEFGEDDVAGELLAAQHELAAADEKDFVVERFDWFTTLTGVLIVSVALLMGAGLTMRLGWVNWNSHRNARQAAALPSSSSSNRSEAAADQKANAGAATQRSPSAGSKSTSGQSAGGTEGARVPEEGGLRVYENGKEIFRAPAAVVEAEAGTQTGKSGDPDSTRRPDRILKVPADVAEGGLVRRVEPQYPEQARLQRVQGPVLLDVRIGREGAVLEVKVVSGDPLLAEAAIAAVRQWHFKPHIVNGQAVETETEITLKFTLPSE